MATRKAGPWELEPALLCWYDLPRLSEGMLAFAWSLGLWLEGWFEMEMGTGGDTGLFVCEVWGEGKGVKCRGRKEEGMAENGTVFKPMGGGGALCSGFLVYVHPGMPRPAPGRRGERG